MSRPEDGRTAALDGAAFVTCVSDFDDPPTQPAAAAQQQHRDAGPRPALLTRAPPRHGTRRQRSGSGAHPDGDRCLAACRLLEQRYTSARQQLPPEEESLRTAAAEELQRGYSTLLIDHPACAHSNEAENRMWHMVFLGHPVLRKIRGRQTPPPPRHLVSAFFAAAIAWYEGLERDMSRAEGCHAHAGTDVRRRLRGAVLVHLGDLFRYRAQAKIGDAAPDWSASKACYLKAAAACPVTGLAFNQLAVLAGYDRDDLEAVHWYLRALAVAEPFQGSANNLADLFDRNRRGISVPELRRTHPLQRCWHALPADSDASGQDVRTAYVRRFLLAHEVLFRQQGAEGFSAAADAAMASLRALRRSHRSELPLETTLLQTAWINSTAVRRCLQQEHAGGCSMLASAAELVCGCLRVTCGGNGGPEVHAAAVWQLRWLQQYPKGAAAVEAVAGAGFIATCAKELLGSLQRAARDRAAGLPCSGPLPESAEPLEGPPHHHGAAEGAQTVADVRLRQAEPLLRSLVGGTAGLWTDAAPAFQLPPSDGSVRASSPTVSSRFASAEADSRSHPRLLQRTHHSASSADLRRTSPPRARSPTRARSPPRTPKKRPPPLPNASRALAPVSRPEKIMSARQRRRWLGDDDNGSADDDTVVNVRAAQPRQQDDAKQPHTPDRPAEPDTPETQEPVEEEDTLTVPGRISLDDLGPRDQWKVLGRGGFGCVYKAVWSKALCDVAVKELRAPHHGATDSAAKRREFVDEIKRLEAFRFNNILNFYGWCMDGDGALYMVTEMCEGNFAEIVRRRSVRQDEALRVLEDVALALHFMHTVHNCAHLDVAARNVFAAKSGQCSAKLGDFGLCATVDSPAPVMPVLWTPPEVLRLPEAERKATVGRDVWGFGVLAWELMSGGSVPYEYLAESGEGVSDFQHRVTARVKAGETLRCAKGCSPEVWCRVVEPCFEQDDRRLRLDDIVRTVRQVKETHPPPPDAAEPVGHGALRSAVAGSRLSDSSEPGYTGPVYCNATYTAPPQGLPEAVRAAVVKLADGAPASTTVTFGAVRKAVEQEMGLPAGALKLHRRLLKEMLEYYRDSSPQIDTTATDARSIVLRQVLHWLRLMSLPEPAGLRELGKDELWELKRSLKTRYGSSQQQSQMYAVPLQPPLVVNPHAAAGGGGLPSGLHPYTATHLGFLAHPSATE